MYIYYNNLLVTQADEEIWINYFVNVLLKWHFNYSEIDI